MGSELECWRWRRELRRIAERRASKAWGEGPKGDWLGILAEWLGMLIAVALFGGLTWLYLMATPDQVSAEADIGRSQIGHQRCRRANQAQIGHQRCRRANQAQIGHRHSPGGESAQIGHRHCGAGEAGDGR